MKKLASLLLLFIFTQQLSATTFYEQLCNFNFNWKKYAFRAPAGEARHFDSDKEYIQAHLASVLTILRSNRTDQLDAKQYQSRLHLIEVLDGYRTAGKFPLNYYRSERLPVFIDENKTHCAVGFLLQQTGHEDMALRIAAADNYAWLKDIYDPELPAWQQASGFTVEELKLIQGAYDYYRPDAFVIPDKYETPQKPAVMLVYFENQITHKQFAAKPENIWCRGEGSNGILNGKWIQNASAGMPWIVGYYERGLRSGQWQEYYQGTKQLCRTENWRNNKLNGLRKRFDRSGKLIEEILFKDGKAVTKTNYSLEDSLTWVRRPLDSNLVYTEVYNNEGALIASGKEKIYNPGNLLWFQNIELTALNSASIQSRDIVTTGRSHRISGLPFYGINQYNSPPLVEYKKEGDWMYYKEYNYAVREFSTYEMLPAWYRHMGKSLMSSLMLFDDYKVHSGYDSIRVQYINNNLQDFYGYIAGNYVRFHIQYYQASELPPRLAFNIYGDEVEENTTAVKECGQYTPANEKVGQWKYFTKERQLYKTEAYLIPWKEEDEESLVKH